MSISVVNRCQDTTACHNVFDYLPVCTAQVASRTDILMQNVALIIPSLKSLVLSSNHASSPSVAAGRFDDFSHQYM